MLLPFDRQALLSEMAYYAGGAEEIDIMVQSADAAPVRRILELALKGGVRVRIIRDDDLKYAHTGGRPNRDYMNDAAEYEEWQAPLERLGASVRYLQTNHHADPKNFLHSKTMLLKGKKGAVLILGSANYTDAALSVNLENVYVISGGELAVAAQALFERYWQLGRVKEIFRRLISPRRVRRTSRGYDEGLVSDDASPSGS